jgi:chaperonin GroEL (HSP60 family)
LAENSGLQVIDTMAELRSELEKGKRWAGMDGFRRTICCIRDLGIYDPLCVRASH